MSDDEFLEAAIKDSKYFELERDRWKKRAETFAALLHEVDRLLLDQLSLAQRADYDAYVSDLHERIRVALIAASREK